MIKYSCFLILLLAFIPAPSAIGQVASPQSVDATLQSSALPSPISAHRGGRYLPGYPENALETFQYLLDSIPAIIECDVNISADSVLLLLHDASLDRTTTGTGLVKTKEWKAVKPLQLKDDFGEVTDFHLPRLGEVLDWSVKNKVFLTLDVKRGVPFDRVVAAVRAAGAEGQVAIITYNFADALEVYQLGPELKLSVTIRNAEELQRYLDSPIPPEQLLAFTGLTARDPAFYESIKAAGITVMLGTIGNLDKRAAARGAHVYRELKALGVDVFATDRPFEAWQALK